VNKINHFQYMRKIKMVQLYTTR